MSKITEYRPISPANASADTERSLHLAEIAANAALSVGDMLVKASAEATAGQVAIAEKASFHDLVTKYDKESEQIISDYILQHHPDSAIVGEEGGAQGGAPGGGSVNWYIDPIDGTSNFASGIPFFCVSIGAALGDKLLAGVIYDPMRNELFSASMEGAFLNGAPIQSKGGVTDSESLLVTAYPSPHIPITDQDFLTFGKVVNSFATVRRMGSAALAMAYVACGRADVMFEPGINPWDVAAGIFIVEQAGGRCVTFGRRNGQTPNHSWLRPKIIAACPEFDLEQSVMNTFIEN